MKVLVIGSGGREHALCWKIKQSPLVEKVFCAPGNAGISFDAECVNISVTEFEKLVEFAKCDEIALTVVGPEVPLTMGIVDRFENEGLRIFGPSGLASEIEGSKQFSKDLMYKYGIPTAKYRTFSSISDAEDYIKGFNEPFVIKADGLAAGKGVVICNSVEQGRSALNSIMKDRAFGDSGNKVVIEEFLTGEEASFFAFTDGKNILPLDSSQDHKAAFDNDKGPNTGGMGAYSPAPVVNGLSEKIVQEVLLPAINGLSAEGRPYRGILYAGLMINNGEIKVLEFNCRFGDPEAQPLLMRMQDDIVPVLMEISEGDLISTSLNWHEGSSVCVVLASRGYPGDYRKGLKLENLNKLDGRENLKIFHAGTKFEGNSIVTNGGRVLGITSLGKNLKESIQSAYDAVNIVKDDNLFFRTDIGKKALVKN